jgi:drug/metabolite transporter (DMT)-like permease
MKSIMLLVRSDVAGAAVSIASAIVAWLLALRAVLHLPADVLRTHAAHRRPGLGRTLFGIVLIVLGVFLLFLPGPGVLLIFAGTVSGGLPGRDRLLRWLLRRPRILRDVNAFRTRHGKLPLQEPESEPLAVR